MSLIRRCSRTACGRPAVATLTYVYADSTAVLGPLATYAEPHCYDLCQEHSSRLTAPRVREAAGVPSAHDGFAEDADVATALPDVGRRGHLRVLRAP